MNNQSQRPVAFAILALALSGCASVEIEKATDSSQGIPFYLPRPYVQVYEPFVIGSKAHIVSGRLSTDGKYLLIDNVSDQSKLGGLFNSDLSKDSPPRVPLKSIRTSSAGPKALDGSAQGEAETPATEDKPMTEDKPAENNKPGGGLFNVTVTNTSAIFTPTLGRRFFDIVWMPDFDEKYVVKATPGLGNANIGVTMTQGWGLYGMDARIDNSALVKPILDFYSTGLDALSKLAKSKILPAELLSGGGGAQGALEAKEIPPGSRVSIKITRVQVVAPGLYPILKPTENAKAADVENKDSLVIRHIPQRPYTNIAFNTYEVVVIEAAKPSGDTPMNLQRYFDQVGADGSVVVPGPKDGLTTSNSAFKAEDLEKQLNPMLANRKGPGGEFWKLSKLAEANGKLTGTATLVGGSNKPADLTNMTQLAQWVAEQSNGKFVAGNITLTEAK